MSVFNLDLPIAIGSDHAGFECKKMLADWLQEQGWTLKDVGAYSADAVDYPDIAHPVAGSVEEGRAAFGILICGSGNGVCITANKHAGIRAGLCWSAEIAGLIRRHNNANIICIPARFVSGEEAINMLSTFINTAFEGGRHANRVNKIAC